MMLIPSFGPEVSGIIFRKHSLPHKSSRTTPKAAVRCTALSGRATGGVVARVGESLRHNRWGPENKAHLRGAGLHSGKRVLKWAAPRSDGQILGPIL
jgi:hypothetical protein